MAVPETSRDVVNILREDGTPVTSAHVTRVSRNNDNSDLALFVALNQKGEMPMMKGRFYPGDRTRPLDSPDAGPAKAGPHMRRVRSSR